MKKITLLCSVAALLSTSIAWAQSDAPQNAYQNIAFTAFNQFTIPTVIEVPFTDERLTQESFLVIERRSETPVPHYWRAKQQRIDTPLVVSANQRVFPNLTDKNEATSEIFPVAVEVWSNIQFNLQSSKEFTTSELVFDLSRNVVPPKQIIVYSVSDEGTQTVVLSRTTFPGSRVLIPTVSTKQLQIVLYYDQPLGIDEIAIVEESQEVATSQGLRILAMPGESYAIYSNPDRFVGVSRGESGNLVANMGVVIVPAPEVGLNPRYQPADKDKDQIIDERDNCPTVANPDQADENSNTIGDACDDYDKDGVINSQDNCRDNPNSNQADEDADATGDVCDDSESRITEKYDWVLWVVMGLAALVIGGLFVIVARKDPNLMKSEIAMEEKEGGE